MENDEPALPVELEREIFETTALMHPGEIPTLLLVARRILLWVEPFLYRVVRVNKIPQHSTVVQALINAMKSKPPIFFKNAVRHVLLESIRSWPAEEMTELLQLFSGVVNLAIHAPVCKAELLPKLANIPVQRLAGCLSYLFGTPDVDPSHPLFINLTHLQLLDYVTPSICAVISALPALTHLCVVEEVQWPMIQLLLDRTPRLQLLVSIWDPVGPQWAHDHAQHRSVRDPRFVMGIYAEDYLSAWIGAAKGFPDFWSQAEEFVALKRSGVIPGISPPFFGNGQGRTAADSYWLDFKYSTN